MSNNQRYSKTTYLVLCGLFAALMAICSYITIPLPFTPVPINLGTLGVFLAGGILGRKYGSVCVAVYILMGAVGIPVFSGFQGGLNVLVGPTGGYIIGYLAAAFTIGAIIDSYLKKSSVSALSSGADASGDAQDKTSATAGSTPKKRIFIICACSMTAGLVVCYILGTVWFMILMDTSLWASLVACLFPFIPGDIIKIVAGSLLVGKLRPLIF